LHVAVVVVAVAVAAGGLRRVHPCCAAPCRRYAAVVIRADPTALRHAPQRIVG
jgi:hypothetical protein